MRERCRAVAEIESEAGTSSTRDPAQTGPALEHGGRLRAASRLFPGAKLPFLDLSTGINPVPYPIPDLPAETWARLPEPEAIDALQGAAAARYGVRDPAAVVAAPGTQVLIGLLPFALPQPEVMILGPTYSEHAASWRRAGAHVLETEHLTALRNARCAVLCNPNNPDGRTARPEALRALAAALAARDGLLIVDEAFADLEDGLSLAPQLPHRSVVILRSFGKTYGLAGLRLGFALAGPELAGRLRAALGPWAVSGPAAAIGVHALRDDAWLLDAGARLRRDAARLDGLIRTAGLRVVGGTALFRLAQGERAPALFARLGEAGILVRRFRDRPDQLRFGLPGAESAWTRLETALRV